ncbi:hypothetical protein RhiirA4_530796 [Rhizophagus irregularis]|uniref:Uncharacterized protein n=1 Tax=Rhizophagus irregularis TaxID=588596 RepID=A0A2I1GVQ0_9GLOM|nr:hypothetical protein RhiirA4_530796 [Rhizophagus irregularis]
MDKNPVNLPVLPPDDNLVFSDYVGSSYISVPDPLGHGWSLDGLVEKEANMSKEVIHPSVKPEEVVKDSLTEEDVVEYINEARVEIFSKMEYTEQYDRNAWEVLTKQLEEEKMAARLAKEDKTKRVEIDKPEGVNLFFEFNSIKELAVSFTIAATLKVKVGNFVCS